MLNKFLGKGAMVVTGLLALAFVFSQVTHAPTEAGADRAAQAEAARWTGLAKTYAASTGPSRAISAYAARWTGLAESIQAPANRQRAVAAWIARRDVLEMIKDQSSAVDERAASIARRDALEAIKDGAAR